MIFINPWASYHSDDIPDLNPQDDEEAIGCICGVCGYIIASAIFVWLMHFILNFRLNGIISTLETKYTKRKENEMLDSI